MRLTTLLTAGLLGCATATIPPPLPVEERLAQAAGALGRADYGAAYGDLSWVLAHCPATDAGDRALLGLVAIELDARNPARRPEIAAELMTQRLRAGGDTWAVPVVQTLYLLMLDLGLVPEATAPPPTHDAVPEDRRPAPVGAALAPLLGEREARFSCGPATTGEPQPPPVLPGASLRAMLTATEAERAQLAARLAALERELAELRQTLAQREHAIEQMEQELARIRRTLRP